jgi:hypothetical protein
MYVHEADFAVYQVMRQSQGLKPDYSEYLTILIKLFNQVIEQDRIEEMIVKQLEVSEDSLNLLGWKEETERPPKRKVRRAVADQPRQFRTAHFHAGHGVRRKEKDRHWRQRANLIQVSKPAPVRLRRSRRVLGETPDQVQKQSSQARA